MEEYLATEKVVELFENVAVLVFVLDVTSTDAQDIRLFEQCVSALRAHSPEARLFVLLHKADLLGSIGSPSALLKEREGEVRRVALPTLAACYHTSIWDASLHKAWSSIVSALVPNLQMLQNELGRFQERLKADEVVLFEAVTLLVLAHTTKRHHPDAHRFEKLSTMLKQLRGTTKTFNATPTAAELVLEDGTGIVIGRLTDNALLLAVVRHAQNRITDISNEIAAFRPIFTAVIEAQPEVDPHML
jgi:Ras-related GTP-binding protein A/B